MLASIAGLVARWAVDDALPPGFPYLTFFPAVIIVAFFLGARPGIVAAVLCGMLSWYFFIAPFETFALPYQAAVAMLFYLFICTVDITLVHWMQAANRQLAAERLRSDSLAETRAVLFEELQHRVGNNLQMMSSILNLQQRGVADEAGKAALVEASRRLGVVGRLQRTLYHADGAQLSLANYIDRIVRDTLEASGRTDIDYHFDEQATDVLPAAAAVPTALVVSEAVSNALEHGYGAARGGVLEVTVVEDEADDTFVISIRDEGRGLPQGFVLEQADSLGLRIASNLARGLGGRFTLDRRDDGPGTVARLTVPRSHDEPGDTDAAA
ncbi:sensor histidine kinase [Aurantiacibacter arachoides]|nr:sensor histidine kinase [Aurantiacibacter arachoides]